MHQNFRRTGDRAFTSVSLVIETRIQNIAVMAAGQKRWKRNILSAIATTSISAMWVSENLLGTSALNYEPCDMPIRTRDHKNFDVQAKLLEPNSTTLHGDPEEICDSGCWLESKISRITEMNSKSDFKRLSVLIIQCCSEDYKNQC